MKPAALGFRVHSGWAAVVAVAGPADAPSVVIRRKVELVGTFTYTFRQPYHTAARMRSEEAPKFIERCRDEAGQLGSTALREIKRELASIDLKVRRCGLLLASARPLPPLERILASHALIHTADGELFRAAIARACQRRALPLRGVKERDLLLLASQSLRIRPDALRRRLTELGRGLGPPWSQDEKLSALIAWLVLVR